MRLAKIASAFAIVFCAAVFGVILLQKMSVSVHASFPTQGTPANGQAPTLMSADAPTTNASGGDGADGHFPAPCLPIGCGGVLMRG